MRGNEAVRPFANAAAGTSAAFELMGGAYVLDFVATGTGTVDLQRLGPDGATYFAVITQITANGTSGSIALPPGQYKVVVATFTAIYVSITRIPGE